MIVCRYIVLKWLTYQAIYSCCLLVKSLSKLGRCRMATAYNSASYIFLSHIRENIRYAIPEDTANFTKKGTRRISNTSVVRKLYMPVRKQL